MAKMQKLVKSDAETVPMDRLELLIAGHQLALSILCEESVEGDELFTRLESLVRHHAKLYQYRREMSWVERARED